MRRIFAIILCSILSFGWFSAEAKEAKMDSSIATAEQYNSKSMTVDDLKAELSKNQAESRILEKLIQQKSGNATVMSCSGANSCCCSAGSYGYCTTAKECKEVGGSCRSASGC